MQKKPLCFCVCFISLKSTIYLILEQYARYIVLNQMIGSEFALKWVYFFCLNSRFIMINVRKSKSIFMKREENHYTSYGTLFFFLLKSFSLLLISIFYIVILSRVYTYLYINCLYVSLYINSCIWYLICKQLSLHINFYLKSYLRYKTIFCN